MELSPTSVPELNDPPGSAAARSGDNIAPVAIATTNPMKTANAMLFTTNTTFVLVSKNFI